MATDLARRTTLFERRRRPRYPVQWQVRLYRESNSHPIEGVTRDISSLSFFCVLEQPLSVGEQFRCSILIPSLRPWNNGGEMTLDVRATVTRVENCQGNGGFGVACLIEEYRVVPAG